MNQKKCWTPIEDQIIKKAVEQMGDRPRWKSIAQKVNQVCINSDPSNRRTPKQCRQRWHNKLDPQILDKQWDQDQINKLFQLHNEHGNKWSLIATMMNGRTDNSVKNKFYSALRKGMRKINKYIVNLKRKLAVNKNTCIKQFKEVVLTKLIAVADKKYDDKLDVKQNSRNSTEKLSEAIKLALVQVSKNDDDYIGHVQNGIADDDYFVEETLFKNIQEFCRNCKRKKGKRKDSDEENNQESESSLQMIAESSVIKASTSFFKASTKLEHKQLQSSTLTNKVKSKNSLSKIIEEEKTFNQKMNSIQGNATFEDLNEKEKVLNKNLENIQDHQSFIKFNEEAQKQDHKPNLIPKLSKTTQNQSLQECSKSIKQNNSPSDFDFFENIRSVVEPSVEFEKTDLNSKHPQNFRVQGIFMQAVAHSLQNSNNFMSLNSSNSNIFGQKSGTINFLGKSRLYQNQFQFGQPAILGSSSSYSSNSKQEKILQMLQSIDKKDDKDSLQRSTQNFSITQSLQIEDFFRRMSERQS